MASSTKAGRNTTCQPGKKPYHAMISASMTKLMREVDQGHHGRGGWNDEAWKIHFRDQVRIARDAAGGFAQYAGEQKPGHEAREHHNGVGCLAFARQVCQLAKDNREDHHGEKGADERPCYADHSLLVADRDVPPSEDEEQLPVFPEVAPVVALSAAGLEHGETLANGSREGRRRRLQHLGWLSGRCGAGEISRVSGQGLSLSRANGLTLG